MCHVCLGVNGGMGGEGGWGVVAILIIQRLYVNPKAYVVVNLGEEATHNISLCGTHSLNEIR